jgi:hypothetical protein
MLRLTCNDVTAASEVEFLGFSTAVGGESRIEISTDSPVLASEIEL